MVYMSGLVVQQLKAPKNQRVPGLCTAPVLTARRLRKHRLLRCKKCHIGTYPSRACEAHLVLVLCSKSANQSSEKPESLRTYPTYPARQI